MRASATLGLLLVSMFGTGCVRTYYDVEAVSVANDGTFSSEPVANASISAGGRFVVFETTAGNLVEGVQTVSGSRQIYVRDLAEQTTEIVSLDFAGLPVKGSAFDPSISADGRFVLFHTAEANVVPNLAQGPVQHVYVRDRQTGTTSLISKRSNGYRFSQASFGGKLAAGGGGAYFRSNYFRALGPPTIFQHSRQSGLTREFRLTQPGPNAQYRWIQDEIGQPLGIDGSNFSPSRSGEALAFETTTLLPFRQRGSNPPYVVSGTGMYAAPVVHVFDHRTDTLFRVRSDQADISGATRNPSMTLAGDAVAFEANPLTINTDTAVLLTAYGRNPDLASEVFLFIPDLYLNGPANAQYFDIVGRSPLRTNTGQGGRYYMGNGDSRNPHMPTLDRIAFESDATNFGSDDDNERTDIYVHHMSTRQHTLISMGGCGKVQTNGDSTHPEISENGRTVSFLSTATNLTVDSAARQTPQAYAWRRHRVILPFQQVPARCQ